MAEKYSLEPLGSSSIVAAPGVQLAGQTSSGLDWTYWKACSTRRVSSTLRPTSSVTLSAATSAEARGNLKESDPLRIPDRRRQGPKRLTACDDIEGSRPRCRWGVEATLSAQKLGASRSAAELGQGEVHL